MLHGLYKLLGRNLYITVHDDYGNGAFCVNNLDSYMFVIIQIHAFGMMFSGREVGYVPSVCPCKSAHIHTQPTAHTVSYVVLNIRNNYSVNMHTSVFAYKDIICVVFLCCLLAELIL